MDRPKRQMTEEQLKRLANARKKALEVKKMKAELNKAKKDEEKAKFQEEYDTKVLKKTSTPPPAPVQEPPTPPPVEETDKDIYESQMTHSQEEEEYPVELVPKGKKRQPRASPIPYEPDYKQLYYKSKLEALQSKTQEEQFRNQYARLPPYAHTVDIAKHQIKERVDKAVYDNVYKSLFGA